MHSLPALTMALQEEKVTLDRPLEQHECLRTYKEIIQSLT